MKSTSKNPLHSLVELGQSVWLDDFRHSWLQDNTLARLISEDKISGVTSNPTIFEQAIAETHEYDHTIKNLSDKNLNSQEIYETLVVEDVQRISDLLLEVYEKTSGHDGYVSLEVSPNLAYNTEGTITEAKHLWSRVARPNLMIKVPGTNAGLPAIRNLVSEGINVNVTLLFSVNRYREVAQAWMNGLEDRLVKGANIDNIASVASFFLSRIDMLIDSELDQINTPITQKFRGQTAIVCARLAYQEYKTITGEARWQKIKAYGANPQRLLWASTSSKDPAYSDVKYVEALVGPNTVNTMSHKTLSAYRDHGIPVLRLEKELDVARTLPEHLALLGIKLETVSEELENQGIQKFIKPYDRLLTIINTFS